MFAACVGVQYRQYITGFEDGGAVVRAAAVRLSPCARPGSIDHMSHKLIHFFVRQAAGSA